MVNFATIGSNKIVKNFLKAASGCEGFRYAAAYSRDIGTAEKLKEEFSADFATDDLLSIAGSREVDAVYIASPNSLHFRQAKLMLEHGKHVLCEKSVCSNAEEYKRLRKLADKNSLIFLEAARHLYDPHIGLIEKNLSKLGKIRFADLHYFQYSSRYDKLKAGTVENAFKKELSNGALTDIGVYCAGLSARLFGEPDEIKSMKVMLESGVDGQGSILMSYRGETTVSIGYSKISDDLSPSRIVGEEGVMYIDQIANPSRVEIVYRSGKREPLSLESREEAESEYREKTEGKAKEKGAGNMEGKGSPEPEENDGSKERTKSGNAEQLAEGFISGQFINNMSYETDFFIKAVLEKERIKERTGKETSEEAADFGKSPKPEEKPKAQREADGKADVEEDVASLYKRASRTSFITMKIMDAVRREQGIVFPADMLKGRALLASDYDGTFHFGIDAPPSRFNYDRIDEFRKAGNIFVFASGRELSEFPERGYFDYYIGLNGAIIRDGEGNIVLKNPIKSGAGEFMEKLKNAGARDIRVYTENGAYFDYKGARENSMASAFVKARNFKDTAELEPDEKIYMAGVFEETCEEAEEMCERLDKAGLCCKILRNGNFIDIVSESAGKEEGIKMVAGLLEIPDENIFTIGDSGNDRGMLEAFNGYTVKTGDRDIKEIALGKFGEAGELADYICSRQGEIS